jgi:hypothetical protein
MSQGGAQTWRLVRLTGWASRRCGTCGESHEYYTRPTRGGLCQPVLFPPGFVSGGVRGVEVEVFNVAPTDLPGLGEDDSAYREVARRVARTAIRCERCGERFEDLDAYRDHSCELHYR